MLERKDKFISNVYKARIDYKILGKESDQPEAKLYWCDACQTLMTMEHANKISCAPIETDDSNISLSTGASDQERKSAETIILANGQLF